MTPTCNCGNSEVVKNEAAGQEFFFCRGCRKEVNENTITIPDYGYDDRQDWGSQAQQLGAITHAYKVVQTPGLAPANISWNLLPPLQIGSPQDAYDSHTFSGIGGGIVECLGCGLREKTASQHMLAGGRSMCPTPISRLVAPVSAKPDAAVQDAYNRHSFTWITPDGHKRCAKCLVFEKWARNEMDHNIVTTCSP